MKGWGKETLTAWQRDCTSDITDQLVLPLQMNFELPYPSLKGETGTNLLRKNKNPRERRGTKAENEVKGT